MGSDNVFSIWRYVGKQTPFIVRRNGWFHFSYKVTRVIPKGQYGEAYGYELHDGKMDDNAQEIPVGCCGCGNWELIEDLVEDVEQKKWNCLDDNGNLNFGKYKGKDPHIVFKDDKKYGDWALGYVGGLDDLLFSKDHNVSLKELDNIKRQIKSNLNFSSDDWIKSRVDMNYDFCLDMLKKDVFLKNMSVEEASNKMNTYYKSNI